MKKFFLTFLISFFCLSVFAHHIVGGEMLYEYLGPGSSPNTSQYKITLKLFRNDACDLVANCSPLPPSVIIGIFNNDNNSEFTSQTVPQSEIDIVPVNPFPPCILNAPQLNYHVALYTLVIDLPSNTSGYTASFQTCCRVDIINNVINGGGTGATYSCSIPHIPDSSPAFDTKLDVICQFKKFTLDFSSKDKDGDSLVYSFVDAYDGGVTIDATPTNPAPPPYGSIIYDTFSGYSGFQPLGNLATINPNTGIISGIAPAQGAYVVCVAVRSYKNGQFVAEHRKDFIVNIGNCDFSGAQLDPIPVTCDGFTVNFKNAKASSLDTTYLWTFGDPASGNNNISTQQTPTHTYTDTGVYITKLVVNNGSPCADSATLIVRVYPGFFPGFTTQGQCKNTQIQFTDTTKTNYGVVNSWTWDFGDPSTLADTSHIKNPKYTFSAAGNYDINFTVTNSKGCSSTITKTISITDKPDLQVTNDTLICSIDTLQLNAVGNGSFLWTPNYNINNQTSAAPLASPKVPTTYYVTLTDPFGCKATDSVFVNVKQFVTVDAGPDQSICGGDSVQLQTVSDALHYKWSPSLYLNNDLAKYPLAFPPVTTKFYVIGNIGKCQSEDSVTVKVTPYPLKSPQIDTALCIGNSIQLHASGGSIYAWSPPFFLNNPSIPDPVATPARSIRYIVAIYDTAGCSKPVFDTVVVLVNRVIADAGPRDTSIVIGQPLQLNATGGQLYTWSPSAGLSNAFISNPIAILNSPGTVDYVVHVSDATGCFGTDTITVRVFTVTPGIYLPNAFTPNGDGLNDLFVPVAIGIKQMNYFKVFNRWGQLMFSTTQLNKGWDGTYNGSPQNTGVFVWIAEGVDFQNNTITQKGTVTLIR